MDEDGDDDDACDRGDDGAGGPPGGDHLPARGHEPVLLAEVLEMLEVIPGGFYVDGTVGLGGHASALLRASEPNGRLLGFDRDSETLARAAEALAQFGDRVRLVHSDYKDADAWLSTDPPDGVLLDLGVSSVQIDTPERGFSFRNEGPLDMRMDQSQGETAGQVVNQMREADLADLIYRFGEERASRRIARAIVEERRRSRIKTTTALATVVRRSAGRSRRPGLDPATRTFQALRIHVNRELQGLDDALAALARRLRPGGRLAVIAFHSLEDREVKHTFRALQAEGFRVLTRKPVRPGPEEASRNPRSRSARLRVLERPAAPPVPADEEAA